MVTRFAPSSRERNVGVCLQQSEPSLNERLQVANAASFFGTVVAANAA